MGKATHYDSLGISPSSTDPVADTAEIDSPRTLQKVLHVRHPVLCPHHGRPTDLSHHAHAPDTQDRRSTEVLSGVQVRPRGRPTRVFVD